MPTPQRVTKNYEGEVDLKKTKERYEPKFPEREGGVRGGGGLTNKCFVSRVWMFFLLEPLIHQASDVMHFIGHNYQGCY